MNKVFLWLNGVLVVLVIVLGFIAYRSQSPLGAQSNFSGPINSLGGFQESGTFVIADDGSVSSTVGRLNTLTVGSGAESIFNEIDCVVRSADFPAVTSSTPAATSTTATGIALGDAIISTTLATSTQQLMLFSTVSGTADTVFTTAFLPDGDSVASINLSPVNLTICWADPDD